MTAVIRPTTVPSPARRRRYPVVAVQLWLAVAAAMAAALAALPPQQSVILAPTFVALWIYGAFVHALHARVGSNLFGEIGFLYMSLALAYTVLPAFTFLALDFDLAGGWVWENLALLLPAPDELGLHLWRHALFVGGVALGYLLLRKTMPVSAPPAMAREPGDVVAIVALIALILVSIAAISVLSAPVTSYIDHYTRYDHLPRPLLLLVYVFFSAKTFAYYILLTLLLRDHRRFGLLAVPVVVAIAAYETTYSFGSRIETLSILLATMCIFHFAVRRVTVKAGLTAFVAIAAAFSVVELFRSLEFDVSDAKAAVTSEGATPATEFGAVFFTGFHLYAERAQGAMPPTHPLMFFNDVLALIPFVDHYEWNPQYWYARHYYPDAAVPPQTMGPIADSAIWGGEADLAVRGVVNGLWYAALVNWFVTRRHRWWALVVYSYLFATCVMALKYSVFYQLGPLFRIVLPGILAVALLKRVVRELGRGAATTPAR